MVALPLNVAVDPLDAKLGKAGLRLLSKGKVRHTYEVPGHDELLFLLATNRLSIFDIVLRDLVAKKGEILTAITVFWLTSVLQDFDNHLVAFGSGMERYLPSELAGNFELQKRGMFVKKLKMSPYECIVRGYLTGSGWKAYQRDGMVCGHCLPSGLYDGAKLPKPIFTPTTKAESGHDEHVLASQAGERLSYLSLDIYDKAAVYARGRGIIIADTKFEFGLDGLLGDEVLTPDSSRFWDEDEWQVARANSTTPPSYDKEPVRKWGKGVRTPWGTGIHTLDPDNNDHLEYVHELVVPDVVLKDTTSRYEQIFRRLAGKPLSEFQIADMLIGFNPD